MKVSNKGLNVCLILYFSVIVGFFNTACYTFKEDLYSATVVRKTNKKSIFWLFDEFTDPRYKVRNSAMKGANDTGVHKNHHHQVHHFKEM